MEERRWNHIRIAQETKDELDRLKAPGQNYDGVVRELIAIAKALLPARPNEGPPLPSGLGIRWRWARPQHKEER